MAAHQQLLYHIVFSTKSRTPFLQQDSFRENVWQYMAGIVKNLDGFALNIGGFHDHAHLLVRIPAKMAVSDFVGKVKANTSKHINDSDRTGSKFHWQDGYGAFTVSPSNKIQVAEYIENQMEHHKQLSFKEEFLILLEKHGIEFQSEYLWE
jgi:REP element-mobilizing transposase RayT